MKWRIKGKRLVLAVGACALLGLCVVYTVPDVRAQLVLICVDHDMPKIARMCAGGGRIYHNTVEVLREGVLAEIRCCNDQRQRRCLRALVAIRSEAAINLFFSPGSSTLLSGPNPQIMHLEEDLCLVQLGQPVVDFILSDKTLSYEDGYINSQRAACLILGILGSEASIHVVKSRLAAETREPHRLNLNSILYYMEYEIRSYREGRNTWADEGYPLQRLTNEEMNVGVREWLDSMKRKDR